MGWIFAVLSSLAWVAFDASRKGIVTDLKPSAALVWLMLGQAPLFVLWAVVAGGSQDVSGYLVPGGACAVLNVGANLLFLETLRTAPISRVVPLMSLTPLITSGAGFLLLGEVPRPRQLLGVALVALGAVVLSRGKAEGAVSSAALRRGALMMLAVAVLWSLTSTLDKVGMQHVSAGVHGATQTGAVGLAMLTHLASRSRLADLRPGPVGRRWLALGVATATLALGLQLVAVGYILVTLMEALKRALGMTAAVLVGRFVFGEELTAAKVATVAVMAVGILLVLL